MDVTPEEAWSGEKIDLSHLRVFGSRAFMHIPKECRKKLDSKSREMIFVGYCENTKGYRLIDPKNPYRVYKARDVVFLEDCIIAEKKLQEAEYSDAEVRVVGEKQLVYPLTPEEGCDDEQKSESVMILSPERSNESEHPIISEDQADAVERRYPLRERHPKELPDMVTFHSVSDDVDEPKNVKDALSSDDESKWREAMKEEYDSLLENDAWILVDRPRDRKVVKNKWVFKLKRGADGEQCRFRARLVAKGFSQEYGIDYDETFSPVIRNSTFRALLALATELNLDIDHVDVVTAFLNGDLEEEIYMEQPESFVKQGQSNKVCLLKKAIYGLKQASRVWNKKLHNVLIEIGYKRSNYESCVYSKITENGMVIISLYVDDIVIFSNDKSEKERLKAKLMSKFKCRDLGEPKHCLGLRISRDRSKGEICVDQRPYIEHLLSKFGMKECKPVNTPLDLNYKLCVNDLNSGKSNDFSHLPYQCLVGSLMYLAVCSRPDIAHAASVLSQSNSNYNEHNWKNAKRVLRYLKGTLNYGLVFRKSGINVEGYVDADWGNDMKDRRSYTGFVFKLAGAAVSWESKKQRTVAMSSTEAEYMALAEAAKEAVYIQGFLSELIGIKKSIVLYNDNQGAQKLVCNPVFHNRTKHIDIRHHFIRDLVECEKLKLMYLPTDSMPADVLAKGLGVSKHNVCLKGLGMELKH